MCVNTVPDQHGRGYIAGRLIQMAKEHHFFHKELVCVGKRRIPMDQSNSGL